MPTSDTQVQMGYVSTIALADSNSLEQNSVEESHGCAICLTSTTDLLAIRAHGCTVCLTDTLDILATQAQGCSVCLTSTLNLLSISTHGATISLSGLAGLGSFLDLDGDIIYYGEMGDVVSDLINIATDFIPKDTLTIIASGVGGIINNAPSGAIQENNSGGLFVNQSGVQVVLPSGSSTGTAFSFLRTGSGIFQIAVADQSSNIVYSSGSNIKEVALGGLYSHLDLIYNGSNWIASRENDVVVVATGVA